MSNKVDLEKVSAWIRNKWSTQECPLCKHQKFKVGSIEFEMKEFKGSEISVSEMFSGAYVPLVLVTCSNCGYIIPLSAVVLGIENPDGKK